MAQLPGENRTMLGQGFPGVSLSKESTCNTGDAETWVQSLGCEDPLEEGMATNSYILAWRVL